MLTDGASLKPDESEGCSPVSARERERVREEERKGEGVLMISL